MAKTHDGLPALKAGQRLYKLNEDNVDAVIRLLSSIFFDGIACSYLRANNPFSRFMRDVEDNSYALEDDFERCEACKGSGDLEALWLYPGEVTMEAIGRLLERGIRAAEKRNSSDLAGLEELKRHADAIGVAMKLNT